MAKFVVLYFLILGAAIVTALLIMLTCGWRPDLNQEKRAWKTLSPAVVGRIIIPAFCGLCAFALCKIAGIDDKHGRLIAICLLVPFIAAASFWSYRKRNNRIKKLNKELTSNWKDNPKE